MCQSVKYYTVTSSLHIFMRQIQGQGQITSMATFYNVHIVMRIRSQLVELKKTCADA